MKREKTIKFTKQNLTALFIKAGQITEAFSLPTENRFIYYDGEAFVESSVQDKFKKDLKDAKRA